VNQNVLDNGPPSDAAWKSRSMRAEDVQKAALDNEVESAHYARTVAAWDRIKRRNWHESFVRHHPHLFA
jgi:hypothetical protein